MPTPRGSSFLRSDLPAFVLRLAGIGVLTSVSFACDLGINVSTSSGTDGGCAIGSVACSCTMGGGCDPGLVCTDGLCLSPSCGDGIVQGVEECDDANAENTDACTNQCLLAQCGDGILRLGVEQCDHGGANDDFGVCKTDCLLQSCGDGFVGPGEHCDHGPANGLDGVCELDCTWSGFGTTGTTTSGESTGGETGTTTVDPSTGGETGTTETTGASITFATLFSVADTWLNNKDVGNHYGNQTGMGLGDKDLHRPLVRFDSMQLAAVAAGKTVLSATLELTVAMSGGLWIAGETVRAHRVNQAWTEAGANWTCANDIDPATNKVTCASGTAWSGGNYAATATASAPFANGTTKVTFDVTQDVQDFLAGTLTNNGWLIRKTIEGTGGIASLASRETASPPKLVLELQ